jgi:serine/threonine protein kinase
VAVKIIPRQGKSGPRARREAQALAALDHPRCLRAYACGRDAESVYIAYEYVPGRTLREALRAGELSDADAVETAAQALEGLAHAHARGIVHRDVKPANVLLADADRVSVRLLDFGLARVAEADTLTAAGDVPGTLAYIPPERLRGEHASPAGDVYSVGVLLHEALAGRHPFWRPSLAATAEAIAEGAPPLARLRPDLPQPLLAAVDRAVAVDPASRPSAAKLAKALRRSRDGGARCASFRPCSPASTQVPAPRCFRSIRRTGRAFSPRSSPRSHSCARVRAWRPRSPFRCSPWATSRSRWRCSTAPSRSCGSRCTHANRRGDCSRRSVSSRDSCRSHSAAHAQPRYARSAPRGPCFSGRRRSS